MRAHIGVDDESGLVHSVAAPTTNITGVTQVNKLLHGQENIIGADARYTDVEKRAEHEGREMILQIVTRRSTYNKLCKRAVQSQAQDKGGAG